ncbi:MAG TPA: hypothetical protein VHG08_04765 [Longimicrobium sp.]|nr:hypothetical protein [Longimicrobium sp.]
MNPRIQIMLDSRQIEAVSPAPGEVEGMWSKAVRTLGSTTLDGLDPDARFTLLYQAALRAATAVIRSAGFRVRGDAHHHHTFGAVAALDLGDLSDAGRDLNVIRQKRHQAIYDWETALGEHDIAQLRAATRALFAHAHRQLRAGHPAIQPLPHDPALPGADPR